MTTADRKSDLFSVNKMVLLYPETHEFLQELSTFTLAMVFGHLLLCLENPPLGWDTLIYTLFLLELLSIVHSSNVVHFPFWME